jgi:hypothetical protein
MSLVQDQGCGEDFGKRILAKFQGIYRSRHDSIKVLSIFRPDECGGPDRPFAVAAPIGSDARAVARFDMAG